MVLRYAYPYILPTNQKNRFRPPYYLFFESIDDILGQLSSSVVFNGNDISTQSTLKLEATTVKLKNVELDFSGTTGNVLTATTTTLAEFSTPLNGAAATGFMKAISHTTVQSGWVLMDDGTIGDASSSATTRANADTEDLYVFLWNNFSNTACPVSGGRGASANSDYAAHKTITLPPVSGRLIGASGAGSGLTSRTLGDTVGEETHSITTGEMAPHGHYYGYFDLSGSQDTTSRSNYGTHGEILIANSTTPDASATTTSNTTTHTNRNNMEATAFLNWIIKL